ncbi:MAG: chemotaxis protein CheD [Syntrophomonadaceae bacterium]|jgi:chemotaxis protein CheD|nr:chemotaxis protein CheD [Syntrophomonadaceae bacterium]
MDNVLHVGIADMKIATPPLLLMTTGLGSCIGICFRDESKKIACLVHIMLPSCEHAKGSFNKAKFADSGIIFALSELEKKGVIISKLTAKIAGGAQMFKSPAENDIMKIGYRNAVAVEEHLKKHNIRLLAKDVGGNFGRTIVFDPANGALNIKTIGHGERMI